MMFHRPAQQYTDQTLSKERLMPPRAHSSKCKLSLLAPHFEGPDTRNMKEGQRMPFCALRRWTDATFPGDGLTAISFSH